ncbi:hypothetical protein CSUI_001189, partial [Cystoisospora suis]
PGKREEFLQTSAGGEKRKKGEFYGFTLGFFYGEVIFLGFQRATWSRPVGSASVTMTMRQGGAETVLRHLVTEF